MTDRRLLYIIACSNQKRRGGRPEYSGESVGSVLSPDNRDLLLSLREGAYLHIAAGGFTRHGNLLCDLPFNRDIRIGADLAGAEAAEYLPAIRRYQGRFYNEIDPDRWTGCRHHVLIVSGLYGLLLPEESIQLYSLHLGDSQIINDHWRAYITEFIQDFAFSHGIETIVDMTADHYYSSIIDWETLGLHQRTCHAFGEQQAGAALLHSLGCFMNEIGLGGEESEIARLLKRGVYQTRYDTIRFLGSLGEAERLGLPLETIPEHKLVQDQAIETDAQPELIREFTEKSKVTVHVTFRVLEQWNELEKDVRAKVTKALLTYVKNPQSPGLGLEKINIKGETVMRMRIDQTYRMHVDLWDGKGNLVIRGIGPHRLEGVG